MVPAILYGGDKQPQSITLNHSELMWNAEHEAFYSKVITLKVDGKIEKTILRDLQRHPSRSNIVHVDLQRVVMDEKLRMDIPLHFLNEESAIGVKEQGGLVSHLFTEVEVECYPGDLPEYIDVDVAELKLNESMRLSDLHLPKGVELVELAQVEVNDSVVVSINPPRAEELEVEEEVEAIAPEVEDEVASEE
jgi:large subunit ribosomal protein L25